LGAAYSSHRRGVLLVFGGGLSFISTQQRNFTLDGIYTKKTKSQNR